MPFDSILFYSILFYYILFYELTCNCKFTCTTSKDPLPPHLPSICPRFHQCTPVSPLCYSAPIEIRSTDSESYNAHVHPRSTYIALALTQSTKALIQTVTVIRYSSDQMSLYVI